MTDELKSDEDWNIGEFIILFNLCKIDRPLCGTVYMTKNEQARE
jgi:hypothetical protein